jgi:signal transduction histidine kinase
MLRLREDLLQKRQQEDIRKLNNDLANATLSQEEFLQRLEAVSHKYDDERACINRSR